MDYMNIGSSPCEEDCAQVGRDDYSRRSSVECRAFAAQILRHYPVPEGVRARVAIKTFPHDFGSYREVCVSYDDAQEEAVDYALSVENDSLGKLATWDREALDELDAAGFPAAMTVLRD